MQGLLAQIKVLQPPLLEVYRDASNYFANCLKSDCCLPVLSKFVFSQQMMNSSVVALLMT